MADRRPIAISIVILTIAIFIFAASLFVGGGNGLWISSDASQGSGTRGSSSRNATNEMERGSIDDKSKLPQDIVLHEASTSGTVTGKVLCGNCTYKTGEACNVMIYDESNKRLASVLPNEHYDGLNALIGST
jgi:hypothetical protein